MASVFDEERLEWIEELGVRTHKVASRVAKNDRQLTEKILKTNKPTIISTGMNEMGEFAYGHDNNIDYLFCVSEYPTFLHNDKLAKMPEFKKPGYVGYSDHCVGIAACVRAYNRGAKIIEKHFSNNIFAQSRYEGGHIGSFDEKSLREYVNLTKQLSILEAESARES